MKTYLICQNDVWAFISSSAHRSCDSSSWDLGKQDVLK